MTGCVTEVFATLAATEQHTDLVALAETAGVAWTLVEDRALASLSDSVTPAGVVAVCHHLDRPLAHLLGPAPGAGVDLRRRARPRQRGQRRAHHRRGRR